MEPLGPLLGGDKQVRPLCRFFHTRCLTVTKNRKILQAQPKMLKVGAIRSNFKSQTAIEQWTVPLQSQDALELCRVYDAIDNKYIYIKVFR